MVSVDEEFIQVRTELAARRILVPRSRTGRNVLADALRALGAHVVEVPHLEVEPPSDLPALDRAVSSASRFAWLLFSGEHSVITFFSRPGAADLASSGALEGRVVALGLGTVDALRDLGIRPDLSPRVHRPTAVLSELGLIADEAVLLVREETAENALPDALRRAGADVTAIAGYRLAIRVDDVLRHELSAQPFDLLALPNPTAARILRRTLDTCFPAGAAFLDGVPIYAVGPSTAEAATRYGFPPDHVAAGRLADLMRDLVAEAGR